MRKIIGRTFRPGAFWLAALLVLCAFGLTMVAHAGDLPPIPLTTESQSERISGDVNDDKSVDLRDAVVLMRFLAGGWNVTINTSASDVNADKIVDLKDVALIRRYLAGGWGVTLQ